MLALEAPDIAPELADEVLPASDELFFIELHPAKPASKMSGIVLRNNAGMNVLFIMGFSFAWSGMVGGMTGKPASTCMHEQSTCHGAEKR